jgi:MFS transporter, SP family, arabinose:H+ symporter
MEAAVTEIGDFSKRAPTGNLAFLTLISLISAMGGFLFGYETVVIAGTIAPIQAQFALSSLMEGWFVSSGLVGCMAGVVLAGALSDRFGRKKVLVVSGVLLTVASIGCAVSPDTLWLVILRITGGIGVGIASIVSPLYISEVSPPHLRGRLVSIFQLTITIGIVCAMLMNALLLSYSLANSSAATGGYWHWLMVDQVWRGMFALQALPSITFALLALSVPDSPRWLVTAGRGRLAHDVLMRLRGHALAADSELQAIEVSVAAEASSIKQIWKPGLRRALFIGVFLAVFSELSGITVVMYYGPVILNGLGLSSAGALDGHAVIGGVLAVCTLFAVWLVDRVGRRKLLLVGISGAFVSLLLIGLDLLHGEGRGYVVVALLCTFVGFFAFSLGPIKWIVISEIFPTRIRARAMSIATIALWATDVIINLAFPTVRERFGMSAMFLLCAALLLVQWVVVARKLPETRGMTLEAIESIWV